MQLAEYVIRYLKRVGIQKVFVVYGAAIGDLVDAFSRVKGIDYVCPMHEQAATFAAEVYTKVSGKLCAVIVTSGPGGTNLLTGIANFYYDSIPGLFITGQINSQFLKKTDAVRQVGFQENDILAMARPITKGAVMIRDWRFTKFLLDDVFELMTSGRPGPVLIDIPMDIQRMDLNEGD